MKMSFKDFLADQKKRFVNVGQVFASIATGKGTTANVKNQTVKKALEGATKNPLTVAGTALAGASVAFAGKKIVQGVIAKKAAVSTGGVLKQGGTGGTIAGKSVGKKIGAKAKVPTMTERLTNAAGVVGAAKSIIGNRSQQTSINPSLSGNPVLSAVSGTPMSESITYENSGALPSAVIGETVMVGSSNSGSIVNTLGGQSLSTQRSSYGRKRRSISSTKTRSKSRKRSKSRSRSRSKKKRYGTAKQYRKKGGKSVKYTKNGQPYIILSSGKARFIKGRRKK